MSDGWKLVPEEPTEAMAEVGTEARWRSPIRDANNVREIYRVMLAAAPAPQPAQEPVAWRVWWPGAGSADSTTEFTHWRDLAEKWEQQGAWITPLYAAPPTYEQGRADGLREAAAVARERSPMWEEAEAIERAILALIPTTPEESGR